jgi:GT2 family glycosyltransferase
MGNKLEISIVIPSFRRYNSIEKLINGLNKYGTNFNEIIVVDSTDISEFKFLGEMPKVKHIRSEYKNGLFQRFLGSLIAKNDYILFLDNDMELFDSNFFHELPKLLNNSNISGIAISFKDKHANTTLNDVPKSIINIKAPYLRRIKGIITGYPELPIGKYGYCGIRGPQPNNYSQTEWLGGGAFLAKKELVFKNLNFQFIDLFENKLGMGEDPLLGFMLSKLGNLMYYPNLTFLHNDQRDSAYSLDLYSYSKRVTFSRFFLSYERSRIIQSPILIGMLYTHWYTVFRVLGLLMNWGGNRNNRNFLMLKGAIHGWVLALKYRFRYSTIDKRNWFEKAMNQIDLNNQNNKK